MITVHTEAINNRSDWFQAMATINGVTYLSHHSTRLSALSDVLRQLAVKGLVAF